MVARGDWPMARLVLLRSHFFVKVLNVVVVFRFVLVLSLKDVLLF